MIAAIGTYLPPWGSANGRRAGTDEDAVTMAIASALPALRTFKGKISRVVVVCRELPLLEGGNGAALLAGLGLSPSTDIVEQVGGASAVLDALLRDESGTLVIGVDLGTRAGAAAAIVTSEGLGLTLVERLNRSLPVLARDFRGNVYDYEDPRLLRDRGVGASLGRLGDLTLDAIAGVDARQAEQLCAGDPPFLPTNGASAPIFCLASEAWAPGTCIAAVDQASVTVVTLSGGPVSVVRDEPTPRTTPDPTSTPGLPIPISISAYDRAFDSKLRWKASVNAASGILDFPPRPHDARRSDAGEVELVDLPRTGTVYTWSRINVPVPGKATPYELAIVELDEVGVRALVPVTGTTGSLAIGARGQLVLRLVATRSGIPDYGYAFRPDEESVR